MKKSLLMKSLLLLFALVVGTGSSWADTVSTLTFSSACSGTGTAKLDDSNASLGNATWTVTSDAAESTFDSDRGVHYGTNKKAVSYIQLSTSSFTAGTISKVEVEASGSNTPSLSVTIGGNAFGTTATNLTNSNVKYTFTGSASAGTIVIRLAKSSSANGALYVKSVAVTYTTGGTPTCVAPTFSPVAGTYKSAQTVTISTTTEGATIHYTTDGSEPTATSTTYDSNNKPSVSTNTTIKAIAVKDGYNNSTVASAAYNFVSIARAGTQADPYTVADARKAIDAIDGTKTNVYVTGIVCTGGSDYGNNALNYWISDDGTETDKLEAYRGKNLNNTNFTANTDVKVGEIVTIYGNLTKFNSTYEFTSGNYLVDHKKKPATPTFSPAAGAYTSAQNVTITSTEGATIYYTMGDDPATPTSSSTPYTAAIHLNASTTIKAIAIKDGVSSDVATAAYTIDTNPFVTVGDNSIDVPAAGAVDAITVTIGNLTNPSISVVYYESDGTTAATYDHNWIDTDYDNGELAYMVDENTVNAARKAYFKIHATGDEGSADSELITLTQAPADYASLPFTFNGGSSAITSTLGLNQSGLGSDYSSAPKLKFDTTGDYLILNFKENPGSLSFDIKGNSFSNSTFKVQVSDDGVTYTDLKTYTTLGDKESEGFALASTVRFVKWIYTDKKNGNVALGNIRLVTDVVPVTISAAGLATFASDSKLDFTNVENLEAYIAKVNGTKIELTKVNKVAAGTGVLLRAKNDATAFNVPVTTATADATTGNLFVRGTGAAVQSGSGPYNYVLGKHNGVVGFYKTGGMVVDTDKAYIQTTVSAARLAIDFEDEDVTAIEAVKAQKNDGQFYNLAGQRVAQPAKGLYIVNGKKVIIK